MKNIILLITNALRGRLIVNNGAPGTGLLSVLTPFTIILFGSAISSSLVCFSKDF